MGSVRREHSFRQIELETVRYHAAQVFVQKRVSTGDLTSALGRMRGKGAARGANADARRLARTRHACRVGA